MSDWDPFADPAELDEPSTGTGAAKPATVPEQGAAGGAASKAEEDFAERMRIARLISEQADRERLAREAAKKSAEVNDRSAQERAAQADINRRHHARHPGHEVRPDSQAGALPRPAGSSRPCPTPMQPSKEPLSCNIGGQKKAQPSTPLPSYDSLLDSMEDEPEPSTRGAASSQPPAASDNAAPGGAESEARRQAREEELARAEEEVRKLTEKVILESPDVTTLDLTGMSISPEEERRNKMLEKNPELLEQVKPVIPFNADKVAAAAAEAELKEAAEKARVERLKSRSEGSSATYGRRARGGFSSAIAAQKTSAAASVEERPKAPSMLEMLAKLDVEEAALKKNSTVGSSAHDTQRKGKASKPDFSDLDDVLVGPARPKQPANFKAKPDFSDLDDVLVGPARPKQRVAGRQSRTGIPAAAGKVSKEREAGDLNRLIDEAVRTGDRAEIQRLLQKRMALESQSAAPATASQSSVRPTQPTAAPPRVQQSASAHAARQLVPPVQPPSEVKASSSQEHDGTPDLEEILAQIDQDEEEEVEAQDVREEFLALGDIGSLEDDHKPQGSQAALASIIKMTGAGNPRDLLAPRFPAEHQQAAASSSSSPSTQRTPEEGASRPQGQRPTFVSRRLADRPGGAPGSTQGRFSKAFSMSAEVREAWDAGELFNLKLPDRRR